MIFQLDLLAFSPLDTRQPLLSPFSINFVLIGLYIKSINILFLIRKNSLFGDSFMFGYVPTGCNLLLTCFY